MLILSCSSLNSVSVCLGLSTKDRNTIVLENPFFSVSTDRTNLHDLILLEIRVIRGDLLLGPTDRTNLHE